MKHLLLLIMVLYTIGATAQTIETKKDFIDITTITDEYVEIVIPPGIVYPDVMNYGYDTFKIKKKSNVKDNGRKLRLWGNTNAYITFFTNNGYELVQENTDQRIGSNSYTGQITTANIKRLRFKNNNN